MKRGPKRIYSDDERRIRSNESAKRWRLRNPDKARELRRQYRESNRSRLIAKSAERYRTHRLEELAQERQRRVENPQQDLWMRAKTRAKKLALDFDIESKDIEIPSHCPIFGYELVTNKGRPKFNSLTLDRIDNSHGYVKGNVHVISYRANVIKSDASIEDLERLVGYLKSIHATT